MTHRAPEPEREPEPPPEPPKAPEQKSPLNSGFLSIKVLIIVTLAIALPWLGFQIFESDPSQRPALLDTALAGLLGIWVTKLSVGGG